MLPRADPPRLRPLDAMMITHDYVIKRGIATTCQGETVLAEGDWRLRYHCHECSVGLAGIAPSALQQTSTPMHGPPSSREQHAVKGQVCKRGKPENKNKSESSVVHFVRVPGSRRKVCPILNYSS